MSVLIKGMEMPSCCAACKVLCDAKSETGFIRPFGERLPNCPLIELPQRHGRLIDADALKWNFIRIRDDGIKEYSQYGIDRAPTIIPADYPPSTPLEQVWTEVFGERESDEP